jgi:hypothetical protein
LENLPVPEGPSHQEEPGLKYSEQISPKAVQQGGATSIPTLRWGRDTERAPIKSVSTWIRNQKKEPRILIELKKNPFITIIRKKFRIYISNS